MAMHTLSIGIQTTRDLSDVMLPERGLAVAVAVAAVRPENPEITIEFAASRVFIEAWQM